MSKQIPFECRVLDVDRLVPNPFQPRESFDKEKIAELAKSFTSRGDIQPIIVTPSKKGQYVIVAGERRWRAAKYAKFSKVPVVVREVPEDEVLLDSVIENIHRVDLEPNERENALYQLWEDYGKEGKKRQRWKTQEEMAEAIGIDVRWLNRNLIAAGYRKKGKIASGDFSTNEAVERGRALEALEEREEEEKKKSPALRKALTKPKSRVTARVAREIARELPVEKHEQVVRTIEQMRLDEDEAIAHVEAAKVDRPILTKEKLREIQTEFKQADKEVKLILESSETKKRGELFRNMLAHESLESVAPTAFCPVGERHDSVLVWKCHNLEISKASAMAHEKLQHTVEATQQ